MSDTPLVKESWVCLRGWYCDDEEPPRPASMCDHFMDDGGYNFTVPEGSPPGRIILVVLDQFPMDNFAPKEEDLDGASRSSNYARIVP